MSIFIRLSGGLGNQMFQFALGHRLAKLNHTELLIDLEWFHNIPVGSSYQKERLNLLNCNAKYFNSHGNLKEISGIYRNSIAAYFFSKKIAFKEKEHYIFDPNVFQLKNGQYLDGYWQSYKYFNEHNELRTIFQPSKKLHTNTLKYLDPIQDNNSVMLHVRRGDYLNSKTANEFHGLQTKDYYDNALDFIEQKISNPLIYIFSDDITWAKVNFKEKHKYIFVDNIYDSDNVIDELYLMAQCKHQIIANSSLSWWGAWLNNNPQKIVVTPRQWLIKNPKTLNDLIPSTWNMV